MKQISLNPFKSLFKASKIFALALTLMVATTACDKDDDTEPVIDSKAPSFSLQSTDGNEVKLSDFNNKVVVLFFFGNNCPSCKAAGPNVESMLVKPFSDRTDYMVLGLDQWDGNQAAVEAFQKTTDLSTPLLLNASAVASQYNTTFDRIVVIDKSGKIVFSGTQSASADIATVKAKVMMLLGTTAQNPEAKPDESITAPAFTLKSLDGSDVSLSNFSNKVVVLFFFGNNCPSCKAVAPSIQSTLVTPYASRTDYMVLGLDQWNGNTASVEAFKTITKVSFPLLLNASSVASSYKSTYDRIVVIDKMGKIMFNGTNIASTDLAAAKTKIDALLMAK